MTNEYRVSTLAATAVLGYDLFTGQKWKTVTYARTINSIGMVGSAAIADTEVEIWVGEVRKFSFGNTKGGASVEVSKEDLKYPKIFVPANAEIQAKVTDAALTNPIIIQIDFVASKRRSTAYRTGARTTVGYTRPYMSRAAWVAAGRPRSR